MIKNIVVAISGGVDSAVAAFLLRSKGLQIMGVFMKNWDEFDEHGVCSSGADLKDAEFVCHKLGIELVEVNFVKQYWTEVFTSVINDYENGYTPNPDILCNKHIKFKWLVQYAVDKLNADALATGHYAKSSFGEHLQYYDEHRNVKLLKAKDDFKDQTFFLSQIPQVALKKTIFPLGNYFKNDVKQMALELGLERIVKKKESTGICFIGKRNFQQFISNYISFKPGQLIDITNGQCLGHHNGIHMWTLGQKCPINKTSNPYFVTQKDVYNNIMYLAPGTNHPSLFSQIIYCENTDMIDPSNNFTSGYCLQCQFRFQHTKPLIHCDIFTFSNNSMLLVMLEFPMKALTPGQYAVFYKGEECLGSARIVKVGPSFMSLGLEVPVRRDYEQCLRSYVRKENLKQMN